MKREDISFLYNFAALMEHVGYYTINLLENVDNDEIFSILEEENLDKERKKFEDFQDKVEDLIEEDNTSLLYDLNNFFMEFYYLNRLPNLKKEDDSKTRKVKIFERSDMGEVTRKLIKTIEDYSDEKGINLEKDIDNFTTKEELDCALLLDKCIKLLSGINNASVMDMNSFEGVCTALENSQINVYDACENNKTEYLVRNKEGKLLVCYTKYGVEYLTVKDKKYIERFKEVKFKEDRFNDNWVIVEKTDLTDWHFGVEKKAEVKKENLENKNVKEGKTKEVKIKETKEKKIKKKKKINFLKPIKNLFVSIGSFFKSLVTGVKTGVGNSIEGVVDIAGDLTIGDIVLGIIPSLVMVAYLILLVTGVMDQITFSSNFSGTLFGYDFELSGMFADWLEDTEHGFFSAITLGLIQVILIVIGFVLDLVVHLLFLVLALLWMLFIFIFSMCFYYVFPVAISIWLIINCFRCDSDKKVLAITSMLVGVVCCVLYFLIGMNVL